MHLLMVIASILAAILLAGLGPYQVLALLAMMPPIVAISKALSPEGSPRGSVAHSLYAALSMAALALSFSLGLEALWAVYGVGAALGLYSILKGKAKLGLGDPIPYLLAAYTLATIYWTYPVYYAAPMIVSVAGALLADDVVLKLLCIASMIVYAALLTQTPIEPLFQASQNASLLSDLSLPQALAALLLFYLIVGVAEELQSRALIGIAGSTAVTSFVLLHLPSRLAALSTLWNSNPALAAVLLTTMMHYLLLPTIVLTEAYRRHGLTTAILVHALFDTLVSLPEPLAIATLLVATALDALLRRS